MSALADELRKRLTIVRDQMRDLDWAVNREGKTVELSDIRLYTNLRTALRLADPVQAIQRGYKASNLIGEHLYERHNHKDENFRNLRHVFNDLRFDLSLANYAIKESERASTKTHHEFRPNPFLI